MELFMVNINKISSFNFSTKPTFRAENKINKNTSAEQQQCSVNGCECLANYNKALYSEPCVLAPLQPEIVSNIKNIEGEKIYTSDGKLYSVIQDNDDFKKIYLPDKNNNDSVNSIITIDKKTGNKIKEQNFLSEENSISLKEYSPDNGEIIKSTYYTDGKLNFTENILYKPSGEKISETYNAIGKTFEVFKEKNNHSQHAIFDTNKQIVEFGDYKQKKGQNIDTTINFYNGGIYKIDKHIEAILPNNLGRELFTNDPQLKPDEYFTPSFDIKGHDGEKTYYSNGAIETNVFELNGEKVIAKFNPEGDLTEYSEGNKKITFSEQTQEIEETFDNEQKKSIYFIKNGNVEVAINGKNSYKQIYFDANTKKPIHYEEGEIDEEGNCNNRKSLFFNKNGMLEEAFQF